jgi:hypothetical protein
MAGPMFTPSQYNRGEQQLPDWISDTGWILLTRNNTGAHSIGGSVFPALRVINNVVYLRGNIASYASGAALQIATIEDSNYWPATSANYAASANTTVTMMVSVSDVGALSVWCSTTTGAWTSLVGATYPLG